MEAQAEQNKQGVPSSMAVPSESGREKSDDDMAAQQGEIFQEEAQLAGPKE